MTKKKRISRLTNILCFQLISCDDFLLFCVSYHSEVNTFWVFKCWLDKKKTFEDVTSGNFHYVLTFDRPNHQVINLENNRKTSTDIHVLQIVSVVRTAMASITYQSV